MPQLEEEEQENCCVSKILQHIHEWQVQHFFWNIVAPYFYLSPAQDHNTYRQHISHKCKTRNLMSIKESKASSCNYVDTLIKKKEHFQQSTQPEASTK